MKSNLSKHLTTIRIHRKYVRKACFKMGLIWQGLVHDLSKYSITELKVAKYYDGTHSPHVEARKVFGFSPFWMHHYHVNKHHWQYWIDIEDWPDKTIAAKMPYKYVIESFCDFIGAGKAYNKTKWTKDDPWNYWLEKCKGKRLMHVHSTYLMEKLLWNLKEFKGEKDFYVWYKQSKHYLKECYEQGKLDY